MGLLQDGRWVDQWYDTKKTGGHFVRKAPQFRNWITSDGSAGPSGDAGFKAETGRYHLYVSLACPWAHRTLIFRELKGLEKMISVSVVHWYMADKGRHLNLEMAQFQILLTVQIICMRSILKRCQIILAELQFQFYGTRRTIPLYQMNPLK
jgi:glutathionyl-hydroquinone reductase